MYFAPAAVRATAIGLVVFAQTAAGQTATPDIFPGRVYDVGDEPYQVVAADLNNDDASDFIVVNLDSRDLSILISEGDGTLAPATTIQLDSFALIAAADFDGDGDIDIAAPQPGNDRIVLLLNNGDGTFSSPIDAVSVSAFDLAVGDFNGDTLPDLAADLTGTDGLVILLNNGDNTFSVAQNLFTLGRMATADVDNDGDTDLLTVVVDVFPTDFRVYLNDGTGGAFTLGYVTNLDDPEQLTTGDFNGDTLTDVAIIQDITERVNILTNSALDPGTFVEDQAITLDPPSGLSDVRGRAVTAADLDNDGDTDLAAATASFSATLLNGEAMAPGDLFAAPAYDRAAVVLDDIAAADADDDGDADLAVVDNASDTLALLLNNGDATYLTQDGTVPVGSTLRAVVIADLNNDGVPDAATANTGGFSNTGSVSIRVNDGSGGLAAPVTGFPATLSASDSPVVLAAADINNADGNDLIIGDRNGNTITVYRNAGAANGFLPAETYQAGLGHAAIVTADFDDANGLDIGVANRGDGTVSLFLNDGAGGFAAPQSFPTGLAPSDAAVLDFNDDGAPDIAVLNEFDDTISILINDGTAGFTAVTAPAGPGGPDVLTPVDVDNDSDIDFVTSANAFEPAERTTRLIINNGDGTFQPPQTIYADGVDGIAATDLDGDGDLDFALAENNRGAAVVVFDEGDGTYSDPLLFATGEDPKDIAAADLNADGLPDLVVGNTPSPDPDLVGIDNLSVLLHRGQGDTPCNPADIAPPFGVIDFTDLDEFVSAFGAGCSGLIPGGQGGTPCNPADIAPPFGVIDFTDLNVFVTQFGAGCP